MSSLPQNLKWDDASSKWASAIEPTLNNPTVQTVLLKNVNLASGDNMINHMLGRNLQGWYVVRLHGGWAQIYDKQDKNATPSLTLALNASAAVLIDLVVF